MAYELSLRKGDDLRTLSIASAKYLQGQKYRKKSLRQLLAHVSDKELEYLGSGTYKDVYSFDGIICKVAKGDYDYEGNHGRQMSLREEFGFFPAYYGTVAYGRGKKRGHVSFYEKVQKVRKRDWNAGRIRQAYGIVVEAAEKSYAVDWKHSNFGRRGKRIVYIDEGGIGKGSLPPDVSEGFEEFSRSFQNGMKSVPQKMWEQLKKVKKIGKIKGVFKRVF